MLSATEFRTRTDKPPRNIMNPLISNTITIWTMLYTEYIETVMLR